MTTTEHVLMKIAAKAWSGVTSSHILMGNSEDANYLAAAFKQIQELADAELAAIQKRREAV